MERTELPAARRPRLRTCKDRHSYLGTRAAPHATPRPRPSIRRSRDQKKICTWGRHASHVEWVRAACLCGSDTGLPRLRGAEAHARPAWLAVLRPADNAFGRGAELQQWRCCTSVSHMPTPISAAPAGSAGAATACWSGRPAVSLMC